MGAMTMNEAVMTRPAIVRIRCPDLSCRRILAVPEAARGRLVRCGACGGRLLVPRGGIALHAPTTAAGQRAQAIGRDGRASRA